MALGVLAGLTVRQRQCFELFYLGTRAYGYQPNWRDVKAVMEINSTNGIRAHLVALFKRGWLKSLPDRRTRSLEFARRPDGTPFTGFLDNPPLLGTLSPGTHEPTDRQAELFGLIYNGARDEGYQPSFRELMDHFGFRSPQGVQCHLEGLVKKGFLLAGRPIRNRAMTLLLRPDGTPFKGFVDKP